MMRPEGTQMRPRLPTFLAMLPLLLLPLVAAAEPSEADSAYDRGDYATALAEWQSVAGSGDATASYGIGQIYRLGKGVPYRDFEKAVYWYQRAAGRGHIPAQYEVARIQFEGLVVPRDIDEMMYWLWRAALSGHAESEVMLGAVYEYGEPGINANLTEALKWYLIAARQGSPDLQSRVTKLADRVRAKMAPAQIDAANWLAEQWVAEPVVEIAGVYAPTEASRSIRPSGLSLSR
jgi:TPR repeat protein